MVNRASQGGDEPILPLAKQSPGRGRYLTGIGHSEHDPKAATMRILRRAGVPVTLTGLAAIRST